MKNHRSIFCIREWLLPIKVFQFYIKPEYLNNTDIEKVQYRLPANFVRPENIYLGGKCMDLLSEDNKGGISAVKKHMGTMKHQRAAKSV